MKKLSALLIPFLLLAEPAQEVAALDIPAMPDHSKIIPFPVAPPMPIPEKRKNTAIATTLAIIPGLGHTYLGDYSTAGGLFATFTGSFVGSQRNATVANLSIATNTWFYGIYAAYRDARIYNNQSGFKYSMPINSLAELSYAPFNYRVLKKPEVWGGVLGAFVLATGVTYLSIKEAKALLGNTAAKTAHVVSAFPVGIGEESFFRGFLQSSLLDVASPWGAIATSSAVFGAAHIPNARVLDKRMRSSYYKYSIPFITLFGVYEGWLAYKNNSLEESTAVHMWYDFAIFLASALAQTTVSGFEPRINISFSF